MLAAARQHRRGRRGAGRSLKIPHVGWNALDRAARSADRSGRLDGRAGVLHPQLRRTGHRRYGRSDRARRRVCRRSSSATTSPASSFIREVRRGRSHPEEFIDASANRCVTSQTALGVREGFDVLSKRIIACLDVRDGQVVKGDQLRGPAQRRRSGGARTTLQRRRHRRTRHPRHHRDDRTAAARSPTRSALSRASSSSPSPSAAASEPRPTPRPRSTRAPTRSASIRPRSPNPGLITDLADRYGSQAVIVAIDAKRDGPRYAVYARSGQAATDQRRGRMGTRGRKREAPARSC